MTEQRFQNHFMSEVIIFHTTNAINKKHIYLLVSKKFKFNSFDERNCYSNLSDSLNKENIPNGSSLNLNPIPVLIQPIIGNFLPFWHKSKHFLYF